MGGEDGDTNQAPHKANANDEFLKHPSSGAFFRNPLCEKAGLLPIVLSASEWEGNRLEEALADWSCIRVAESGLKDLLALPTPATGTMGTKQRAALEKIRTLKNGYDILVAVKKSTFVPPKAERRRGGGKDVPGQVQIDKLNIVVSDASGKAKIEAVASAGLIADWNRSHPSFTVKPGDTIVRVNEKQASFASIVDELQQAPDVLRIMVHRDYSPEPEETLAPGALAEASG